MTRARALTWAGGLLAGLLVVVLTVANACGTGPDLDPLPHGEKPPSSIAFSGRPLWDEHALGMSKVSGVVLRGDAAVVAGSTRTANGTRLAVVDARTGAPHWFVDAKTRLVKGGGALADPGGPGFAEAQAPAGRPLAAGDGVDWTVFVQYQKGIEGKGTEHGVAALSGKDGGVRWKRPLFRDSNENDPDHEHLTLLDADARVVLAGLDSGAALKPVTVAFDPATGRELWRREGATAHRIDGDLVLGEAGDTGDDQAGAPEPVRDGTTVMAVDVKTGEERWRLAGSVQGARLEAAAGGAAVVTVKEQDAGARYRTRVIDSRTGLVTKDSLEKGAGDGPAPPGPLYDCADDGQGLIACGSRAERLVTIRPGAHGEPVVAKKMPFGGEADASMNVDLVAGDRVFMSTETPERFDARVVDRAANRLGSGAPGRGAAVSDLYAAFLVPRENGVGLVMHTVALGGKAPEPTGPGRPAVRPLKVDGKPLWNGTTVQHRAPDGSALSGTGFDVVGDSLVYLEYLEEGRSSNGVHVVDIGAGKERWAVRPHGRLGARIYATGVDRADIVTVGGVPQLLVPYESDGRKYGVAGLSLRDGHVRWTKAVPGEAPVTVDAADGETVLVKTARGFSAETVAFDIASRRTLWRKKGVTAQSTANGLVLAAVAKSRGIGLLDRRLYKELIALNASDGKQRWKLSKDYPELELLMDSGARTIVVGTADGGAVLDRATGRELARTTAPLRRCEGDNREPIACEAGPDLVGGQDHYAVVIPPEVTTKITPLLGTQGLTGFYASGYWIFATRPADPPETAHHLALDGAGLRFAGELPGRPVAIGERYVVLVKGAEGTPTGQRAFSVHWRTG